MTRQGVVLARIIQSAAGRARSGVTDRDLLRQFAESGDQDAFAVVVRRHTGLVLGVCRRALSNAAGRGGRLPGDVPDPGPQGGSGRWQPSIANWLFTTARRVAATSGAPRHAGRREKAKAAVPEAVPAGRPDDRPGAARRH